MAGNNSGGPWGGGGNNDDGNDGGRNSGNRGGNRGGGRGPGPEGPQLPEIDEIVRKGQEQLRVLMGGRGGSGGGSVSPNMGRGTIGLFVLGLVAVWLYASFYSVKPDEKSVELLFGKYYATGEPGLNFAAWPVMSKEVLSVTGERTEEIGLNTGSRSSQGLMLTGDENIVDIDFQIVWNITDPAEYLFNLANPVETISAVSESAMREIISRSKLAPILNRDRGVISAELQTLVQGTLDSYKSGINIVRINFERADPPTEVIDSFREVQAAEQTRDTLQKQADAYANKAVAAARGEAAQMAQEAEGYRARVINGAEGEASRFSAVYAEYVKAPEVTRKRLYLETMEKVYGSVKKVIIDDKVGGASGVVPYLPLSELKSGVTK